MTDLFLSYSHDDVKTAAVLAGLLEANGLSVWWDRRLFPGDKFHALIDGELEKAKAVLVLWSPKSVQSDWVLGEAQTARDLQKLIPVKIAECKLPLPYRALHTPEIYKTKAELDDLARILSEKFRTAPASTRAIAGASPKIEFSARSSNTFFAQYSALTFELKEAQKDAPLKWFEPSSWTWANFKQSWLRSAAVYRKYPKAAVAVLLGVLAVNAIIQSSVHQGAAPFDVNDGNPNSAAAVGLAVIFWGAVAYYGYRYWTRKKRAQG